MPETAPVISYCLKAEIQGVFLPELAKEVADGLLIGFIILLWSCVYLFWSLLLEVDPFFNDFPLFEGDIDAC